MTGEYDPSKLPPPPPRGRVSESPRLSGQDSLLFEKQRRLEGQAETICKWIAPSVTRALRGIGFESFELTVIGARTTGLFNFKQGLNNIYEFQFSEVQTTGLWGLTNDSLSVLIKVFDDGDPASGYPRATSLLNFVTSSIFEPLQLFESKKKPEFPELEGVTVKLGLSIQRQVGFVDLYFGYALLHRVDENRRTDTWRSRRLGKRFFEKALSRDAIVDRLVRSGFIAKAKAVEAKTLLDKRDASDRTNLDEVLKLDISRNRTDEEKPSGTIAERLAKLDQYVQKNPNQSVSESVQQLFPELTDLQQAQQKSLALPKEAPALWANDKQPNETPPDFIKRHYEPWLGKGLTRPGLKHLDPGLYRALYNWLQRGNTLPADLDLPTLEEANDRWAASIRQGEAALPANPNELQRAAALLRRRGADQDDGKTAPRKK